MSKIHKYDELLEDVEVGDLLEISNNVFLKITKLTKDVEETLGSTVKNEKKFDAVVVNLNEKSKVRKDSKV